MTDFRVLYVDDDRDAREVIGASLGIDPEFQIRACATGADALSTAAEWSPSIILLDVVMPVMDGTTTLAKLRQNPRTADIPVLFLTGHSRSYEVEHYISLGARGVFSKPFDPMTLAASVRDYISRPMTHHPH
jgi:two-component system OmpR family response regulator